MNTITLNKIQKKNTHKYIYCIKERNKQKYLKQTEEIVVFSVPTQVLKKKKNLNMQFMLSEYIMSY